MHEAILLADLQRRHERRKLQTPLVPGDEILVIDLLTDRSTDKKHSRKLKLDPATGAWAIEVSTYYPDPMGALMRPFGMEKDLSDYTGTQQERVRAIEARFEVAASLAEALKQKGLVTDTIKDLKPGEFMINSLHDQYQFFRKLHPDLRYRYERPPVHPDIRPASCVMD